MYLIRLDDACEYMDGTKWNRMEKLLDSFGVKPIVAIIPNCQDRMFTLNYSKDNGFWERAKKWQEKGWTIGLHGYNHVYKMLGRGMDRGLNPVNPFSEFVGEEFAIQLFKITEGTKILRRNGLNAKCFVAPAHTFDMNTIKALLEGTDIRVISDTIASDIYFDYGINFIPQQCGKLRKLPCKIVTGCYHPNSMIETDFDLLESFLKKNKVSSFNDLSIEKNKRKLNMYDSLLNKFYFMAHR